VPDWKKWLCGNPVDKKKLTELHRKAGLLPMPAYPAEWCRLDWDLKRIKV
jgi:hypothetical protein